MSDVMKNNNVEDVLSSIRRLVSEEERPAPKPREGSPVDRLVLTPALLVGQKTRVTDAAQPDGDESADEAYSDVSAVKEAPENAVEDASVAADKTQGDSTLSDKIAALEEVIARREDHWDPDTAGEDDYAGTAESDIAWDEGIGLSDAAEDMTEIPIEEPSAEETPLSASLAENGATQEATSLGAPENTSATEALIEETIAPEASAHEMPKEPVEVAASTEATVLEGASGDEPGAAPIFATARSEDVSEAATSVAPEANAAVTSTLLLRGIERAEDQPDATGSDGLDGNLTTDPDELDEETLRDLIAEIVREELQGALGERITRNVRKLVRREIHRALAAQEMD